MFRHILGSVAAYSVAGGIVGVMVWVFVMSVNSSAALAHFGGPIRLFWAYLIGGLSAGAIGGFFGSFYRGVTSAVVIGALAGMTLYSVMMLVLFPEMFTPKGWLVLLVGGCFIGGIWGFRWHLLEDEEEEDRAHEALVARLRAMAQANAKNWTDPT